MLSRIAAFVFAVTIATSTCAFPPHGSSVMGLAFTGPCDLVTCAEAWSVTRAMTRNYAGPLFQLGTVASNGATTLDIGQTSAHVADLTTWSAFCGGVLNNCVFTKIYPQIHTGDANNTMIASVINGLNGPACASGTHGAITCACPLRFDATTGLPAIMLALASPDLKYCLYNNNDADADGISGGSHDISVFITAYPYSPSGNGCMITGIAHAAPGPDTFGTDFGWTIMNGNSSQYSQCSSATGYCPGLDVESNAGPVSANISDPSPAWMFIYGSWTTQGGAQPRGIVTGIGNGHSLFTPQLPVYQGSATANMNPGRKVHFAGGDDCPGKAEWLEAGFINAVADASEPALRSNVTSFYSSLTFP